jgi:hypothetical protein
MRAYYFGNMYLSSIQQGIQAAHVTSELFIKYTNRTGSGYGQLHDWAVDHKTMILLNAGYSEELYKLYGLFDTIEANPYPWAGFNESSEALDGAMTCIGIILPERIYETMAICRNERINPEFISVHPRAQELELPTDLTVWEIELIETLNQYGLAR